MQVMCCAVYSTGYEMGRKGAAHSELIMIAARSYHSNEKELLGNYLGTS